MSKKEDQLWKKLYPKESTVRLIETLEELEYYKANAKNDEERRVWERRIEFIEKILKDRENGV